MIRDAAWRALLDNHVCKLPVSVSKICAENGITLIKDSDAHILPDGSSGLSVLQKNRWYILYRDSEIHTRIRYTIAHELGHIFLGHALIGVPMFREFYKRDADEQAADCFATRLLMPAVVLYECGFFSAYDISRACDVSTEAAGYRAERMAILRDRNKFLVHPLERAVYNNFLPWIQSHRKK